VDEGVCRLLRSMGAAMLKDVEEVREVWGAVGLRPPYAC
jgi:hypothetical protein